MEEHGGWYRIDVPVWANVIFFSTNPELSDPKVSEEEKIYGDDDAWFVVSNDGSVRKDYQAGKNG